MGLLALLASSLALAPFCNFEHGWGLGSLESIKVRVRIEREEVMILSSSCDRPNVYQQSRHLRRRVDVWYAKYDFRKRDLDPKDASASKNKTSSNASTGFYSSQPVM